MKTIEPTLFRLPPKLKPAKKRVSKPADTNKNTYVRKYYIHRRIKAAGFDLHLEKCKKTILVLPSHIDLARQSKYITELQQQYNYGVQILNPMTDDIRESI